MNRVSRDEHSTWKADRIPCEGDVPIGVEHSVFGKGAVMLRESHDATWTTPTGCRSTWSLLPNVPPPWIGSTSGYWPRCRRTAVRPSKSSRQTWVSHRELAWNGSAA